MSTSTTAPVSSTHRRGMALKTTRKSSFSLIPRCLCRDSLFREVRSTTIPIDILYSHRPKLSIMHNPGKLLRSPILHPAIIPTTSTIIIDNIKSFLQLHLRATKSNHLNICLNLDRQLEPSTQSPNLSSRLTAPWSVRSRRTSNVIRSAPPRWSI